MKLKFTVALALSTMAVFPVFAGLNEAVQAFEASDYEHAYPEMLALSQEGNAAAMYYLGRMYRDGLGVAADADKAIQAFEQADKSYNLNATVALGQMAIKGEGTLQNTDLGLQYLKKAAYAGSEEALYELGRVYEDGAPGLEKNYTYSFGFYYMGALKGDKRAQLKVARSYLKGRGITQDFVSAQRWYMRSANQGYIPAQEEWARLRAENIRLKNPLDAYSWYSILAAYNSDEAGQHAAEMRDKIGKGFKAAVLASQQKKIKEWRPVPAAKSVPAAERRQAVMPIIPGFNDEETIKTRLESGTALHLDGSAYGITDKMVDTAVTTQDRAPLEQAIAKAVEKNQTRAYGYYGDLLRSRFSDDAASAVWYRKGAEAGDAYAQYQLGKAYCEGRGINPPDVSECYAWLLSAQAKADKNLALTLKDAIAALEAAATEDELKHGKELLAERAAEAEKNKEEKPKSRGLINLF